MYIKKKYLNKIKEEYENFGIPYKEMNYSSLTRETIKEMQETVFEMDTKTLSLFRWCLVRQKNMFNPNYFSLRETFGTTNIALLVAVASCLFSIYTVLNINMESGWGALFLSLFMVTILVLGYWQTRTNSKIRYYISIYEVFEVYEEIVLEELHRREQKSENESNFKRGVRRLMRQIINMI